ncbi:MAG: thioesterase family protein [Candidatus Omnitrophota bacterium]
MNEHTINIRARYKETDQMGVVYYSNYLVWFEVARTEFFRARGIEYRKLEEEQNIYLPVVEAFCRYKAPVRYDDIVTVTTVLSSIGGTRLVFDYEIRKDGEVTTVGQTKHAFVNEKGAPVPVPGNIKAILSGE